MRKKDANVVDDVTKMPSADIELRLMAITTLSPYMPERPIPVSVMHWMTGAVRELQLRRLARSAA